MPSTTSQQFTGGFGVARRPAKSDDWAHQSLARAVGCLPAGAEIGPASDNGSAWMYPVTNLRTVDLCVMRAVARRVPGASIALQSELDSELYSIALRIPKKPRSWPTGVDYALGLFMLAAVVVFVGLQFREHLFDVRTLFVHRIVVDQGE